MFATVFFAILDPASGHLDYVNAGHDAPMLWRRSGAEVARLEPSGAALGLWEGNRCPVQTVELAPGERLFAYTDGVTEAAGASGPFGEAALLPLIAADTASASDLLDSVQARLALHIGDFDQYDDVTMLCVMRADT
jgi:serine phosphatase RsbU (regulator of sigma subunit)